MADNRISQLHFFFRNRNCETIAFKMEQTKSTSIIFNNGESLASEFIEFCPPILRIKIFKIFPAEFVTIKKFDEIFQCNGIYYGFINDQVYVYAQHEIQPEAPWSRFRCLCKQEIVNCFGKKLFLLFKWLEEDFVLSIFKEDQSLLIVARCFNTWVETSTTSFLGYKT